jgi:aspartate aminotransferase
MHAEFDKRRKHMVQRLNALPGVKCLEPKGAFYCFPNVSGVFGRTLAGKEIRSAMDFVNVCLEEAKVALVPGEAFGSSKYVRLSYAVNMETIDKGLDRLQKLLS